MPISRKTARILTLDLLALAAMALVGLGCGLSINASRDIPLPLQYLPKAERLNKAVEPYLPGPGETAHAAPSAAAPAKWERIDLQKFREIVDKKDALILDARPEVFYQLGHVPGAISLPREDFETRYGVLRGELERNKTRQIVVYCSDVDCEDSQLVAEALLKLSYPTVYVFKGGWNDWTEAHLPEEKEKP